MKKLWLFALEGMPDELENPSEDKQACGVRPKEMNEDADDKKTQRQQDQRNAKAMAYAIDWMLMAARVLRDPLFVCTSA